MNLYTFQNIVIENLTKAIISVRLKNSLNFVYVSFNSASDEFFIVNNMPMKLIRTEFKYYISICYSSISNDLKNLNHCKWNRKVLLK